MNWTIVTAFPESQLERRWRHFLERADYPAYHSSPDYFRDAFLQNRDAFAVLATDGGEVAGVLTGVRSGSTIDCGHSGCPQVCMLARGDHDQIAAALALGLKQHARRTASLVSVYSWVDSDAFGRAGFRRRVFAGGDKGIVVLDLARGKDVLFNEFSRTRRNEIKQAIRNAVDVSPLDCDKEFEAFYRIYQDWCAFKDIAPESPAVLAHAFSQTGNRLVLAARHDGVLIAVSTWRFQRNGVIEYAANWSRRAETKAHPNVLLVWRAIEWAVDEGFQTFSMGASHFFLQSFGGEIVPTYRFTLDRTLLKRHHFRDTASAFALRLFRRMPDAVRRLTKRLAEESPAARAQV